MEKKKRVTIYDIAKHLGVSGTTVSRALSDHHSIGDKTKKAVLQAAKEMGYIPNTIAAGLRKKQTNTIGVLIPWINRPFISSMISGIEEVANDAGYNVIISQSCDSYKKEVANAETFFSNRVDGVIASMAMETEDFSHFNLFIDNDIALVFADRVGKNLPQDKVMIDNFAAAFEATEYLIQSGCKRIAHFTGAPNREIYKLRRAGYQDALEKNGIPYNEKLVFSGLLSGEEGVRNAKAILELKELPDGIFSANDTVAVHAMIELKKAGLKIPDDISFIGFNDDPIASIVEPQLTTVSHPALEIGRSSARQIIKRINAKHSSPPENIVLPTQIIVRESTRKLVKSVPSK
ncbi:MAG: LacI family DNA-binding transcriptional regulator [Bacteroidia bacterium]